MNVREALVRRKAILREASQTADPQARQRLLNEALQILEEIEQAKESGTATNLIQTTEEAYGMMGE